MADMFGEVVNVATTNVGEFLIADVAAGANALPVTDASTFDEKGGQVAVAGQLYSYWSVDQENGLLRLNTSSGLLLTIARGPGSGAVTTDLLADERVEIYPPRPEKKALIDLGVDEGEAVFALVPHELTAVIPDGFRDEGFRETVLVEERSIGELYVKDMVAQPANVEVEVTLGDGVPPIASPTPVVTGWVGALHAKWAAIISPDFVSYEVHISTVNDFTPDETTLVGTTSGTSFTVRSLPNDLLLVYDTIYYIKVVAFDVDGPSVPGSQGQAELQPITGPDIAANYVYAGELNAAQITGGEIQADLILSGSIATALSGGRTYIDSAGIVIYDPTGQPGTTLGPEQSVFVGDAEIGGLTVTGGSSIRGTANELSTGAELVLAAGITAPSTAPSVVQDWEQITFTKPGDGSFVAANITSAEKVGSLWVCGYRDGSLYKVYRFDAAGVYHSAGAHAVSTSTALQTTMLGVDGICYTVASNHTILKHRQFFGYTHVWTEDFTASIPGARWPIQNGGVAWDSGSGGRAKLTADSELATAIDNDIKDSFFSAKVTRQSGTDTQDLFMTVYEDATDEAAQIKLTQSTLTFRVYDTAGEIEFESSITYNATTHAYWRIVERDSGAGGDFYFYTSVDGEAWVLQWSHDHDFGDANLNTTKFEFLGQEEGGSGTLIAYIDEVRHGVNNDSMSVAFTTLDGDAGHYMAIGNDGTDLLLADHDNSASNDRLRVRTIDPDDLSVISTYNSANETAWDGPLVGILKGSFDLGASRYVTKQGAGSTTDVRPISSVNGSSLPLAEGFPGAIPYIGIAWDGSNFWGLAGGKIYKHTGVKHTSGTGVVAFAAGFTWYDSNATGGTHETTVSPITGFTLKKRARLTVTSPVIPGAGGTDDPNSVRFYLGLNSGALKLEVTTGTGQNSAILNSLAGSGAAPPGANNFPGGTPAKIKAGSLIISGDGTITGLPGPVLTELAGSIDLNTIITPGAYVQSQDADAVSGSNYPVDYAGFLDVQAPTSGFVKQTYSAHRNADLADSPSIWERILISSVWSPWVPLFDDHGLDTTVANIIVASANWTITSASVRLMGKTLALRIGGATRTTSILSVPGDGNIANTSVGTLTAKYRPGIGMDQGGLTAGSTGRAATFICSSGGEIFVTTIDGGDTAGGLDLAINDALSCLGTLVMA